MIAAPTESCSRLSTRPVIVSPVSRDVNSSISPAMALPQAVDQRDAVLDLEHGADVAHIHGAEVCRLDFLEQNFLQFTGAQDRISGHGSQSLRVSERFQNSL